MRLSIHLALLFAWASLATISLPDYPVGLALAVCAALWQACQLLDEIVADSKVGRHCDCPVQNVTDQSTFPNPD